MWKILSLMLILPAALQAQDRSADDFMIASRQIAPAALTDYPLVRCAALYRSIHVFAGREVMGDGPYETAVRFEKEFGISAAFIRAQENELETDAAVDAVMQDIDGIAGLYGLRYQLNAESTGHAFANDQMWQDDRAYCANLFTMMTDASEGSE